MFLWKPNKQRTLLKCQLFCLEVKRKLNGYPSQNCLKNICNLTYYTHSKIGEFQQHKTKIANIYNI